MSNREGTDITVMDPAELTEHELKAAAKRKELRERLLLNVLLDSHDNQITLEYSGYGDSGGVQESNTTDVEVDDFLWDLMYQNQQGFENNEGGQGTIEWDLLQDKITISHSNNYISTEDFEYEL